MRQWRSDIASMGGGGGCILWPLLTVALIGGCCVVSPMLFDRFSSPAPTIGRDGDAGLEPEEAVREYLRATIEEDAAPAAMLTCESPQLGVVEQWWRDLAAREDAFPGVRFDVDVDTQSGRIEGERATASADVVVTARDGGQESRMDLTIVFTLSDEQGWKVCGATLS